MLDSSFIPAYFQKYYSEKNQEKYITYSLKFRQIKIKTLHNAWIIPQTSIATYQQFLTHIRGLTDVPAHVYATVLQYLKVPQLTTKNDPALCIGGPFVMDFDQKGHILYSREELEKLKLQVFDAADLLQDFYGIKNINYTFSGHRGFHLYAHDFPERCTNKSV